MLPCNNNNKKTLLLLHYLCFKWEIKKYSGGWNATVPTPRKRHYNPITLQAVCFNNKEKSERKRDCHTLTVGVEAGPWTHFDFLLQVLGDKVGEISIMAHCALQFQSARDSCPAALACHGTHGASTRLADAIQTFTVLNTPHYPLASRSRTHPHFCHHVRRLWPILRCWHHGRRD